MFSAVQRYCRLSPGPAQMNIAHIKGQADAVDGWLNEAEGCLLYRLARECSGKGDIVEIGSWKGKLTILLGHGSHDGRRAKIHPVDPDTGSPDHGGTGRPALALDE